MTFSEYDLEHDEAHEPPREITDEWVRSFVERSGFPGGYEQLMVARFWAETGIEDEGAWLSVARIVADVARDLY